MSGIVFLILRTALTIALYAFLGWVIWFLWRDLKYQQDLSSKQQIDPLKVLVENGDVLRGETFSIEEITIGRDPSCECVINSKTISSHHARLSYHQGQWWVEDLGSTNGTLLNQEPVTNPAVVTPGDLIQCGKATITIQKPEQNQ